MTFDVNDQACQHWCEGGSPCCLDNRNGTHTALEQTGHLSHKFRPPTDLQRMQVEVLEINTAVGWRGGGAPAQTFGDGIALIHSEASEALEAYRNWGFADATVTDKPEGVGSECADILIRLLDFVDRWGVDLDAEYERKTAYNRTRPHYHGGRKL